MTEPNGLKYWLIAHFAVDIVFAVPLMVAPVRFLMMLGWQTIDPVTARIASAALFGIGIQSLIAVRAPYYEHRGFLNLKIIWSSAAVVGMAISLIETPQPPVLWAILALFVAFNGVWVYYRRKIGNMRE